MRLYPSVGKLVRWSVALEQKKCINDAAVVIVYAFECVGGGLGVGLDASAHPSATIL